MTQQIVISEKTSVRTEEELGHSEQEVKLNLDNFPVFTLTESDMPDFFLCSSQVLKICPFKLRT